MKRILIVGAGQLGSRHLQSLNLLHETLDITVVDPCTSSLETAKSRFEASVHNIKHDIRFDKELACAQPIDIAIIASTAQNRRSIIETLLKQSSVSHLVLEKLLFTQEQDYYDIQKLLSQQTTKTWVNCPMRMMPYYQKLSAVFNKEAIQYRVSGSQYGLITNAIHYLDHVAFLTGVSEFELDTRYLDKNLIASKRTGYFELNGTLIAHFADHSTAILHCNDKGSSPIQIEIYNSQHRIISREWEQKAWQTSVQSDWKWEEQEALIPFQSTLTAQLVQSLLDTNHCALTDYNTSMKIHLQLLNPLKQFLIANQFESSMDYPFT